MGRKSGEATARDTNKEPPLFEVIGEGIRTFINRRVRETPRRNENVGNKPERRGGVAERRRGDEQSLFALPGAPTHETAAADAYDAVARPDRHAMAGMQRQIIRYPGQLPTTIPPGQRVGGDFLSWGIGEDAKPGPAAERVVRHVRDHAEAHQRILIEAGNGQYARVRTPVTLSVRVINGLGRGVRGAKVRVPGFHNQVHETDEHGLLQVSWNIMATGAQTLVAELLGPEGQDGKLIVVDSVSFTAFGL